MPTDRTRSIVDTAIEAATAYEVVKCLYGDCGTMISRMKVSRAREAAAEARKVLYNYLDFLEMQALSPTDLEEVPHEHQRH